MNKIIETFLNQNKINYILHKHKAVFTCEEAEKYAGNIPGTSSKNLFLKEKKKNNYILLIVPATKRINMKNFGKEIGVKNLTFGKPEELKEILDLTPGSVSPLGLLNDKEKVVKLYIDQEIWDSDIVSFHPNINTESLEFAKKDFHLLIKLLNEKYTILNLNS